MWSKGSIPTENDGVFRTREKSRMHLPRCRVERLILAPCGACNFFPLKTLSTRRKTCRSEDIPGVRLLTPTLNSLAASPLHVSSFTPSLYLSSLCFPVGTSLSCPVPLSYRGGYPSSMCDATFSSLQTTKRLNEVNVPFYGPILECFTFLEEWHALMPFHAR